MVLEFSSGVLAAVLRVAAATPEVEVCGLLLGDATHVADAMPCRNVAADPATAFEIDPAQLIAAHRAARGGGAGIVGCYHSHPDGSTLPSPRDAADAAADGSIWLIVANGAVGCYRAVEAGRWLGRFEDVGHRSVPGTCLPSDLPTRDTASIPDEPIAAPSDDA